MMLVRAALFVLWWLGDRRYRKHAEDVPVSSLLTPHDVLQSLPGRSSFLKHVDVVLQGIDRQRSSLAVLYVDLDNFKLTNNSLGHAAGDQLLSVVAQRLRACFRASDLVARIGGDEFCVVCTEISERSAEGMLSTFNERLAAVNQTLATKIEIACGYATCNVEKGETIEMAFSKADNAMYEQKAKLKQAHGGRAGGR